MVKKIVLATDGSESAAEAARLLAALPLESGTVIQVVCVVDAFVENVLEPVQQGQRDRAQCLVDVVADGVRRAGLEVTAIVRLGDADHEIIRAAEELDADLIVVGTRGRTGLESFVLGSVARNVAQHARCPVLVARAPRHALRQVVLATDGSAHAERAVEFLAEFPLPADAQFTAVHVVRWEYPFVDMAAIGEGQLIEDAERAEDERRRHGEEWLRAAGERFAVHGRHCAGELRQGDPATEILAAAAGKEADLLVFGARGLSLIQRLLVGSVADRLLKHAPSSVLIVR